MMSIIFLRARIWLGLFGLMLVAAPATAEDCQNGSYNSTFETIPHVIFEQRGCTDAVCHGSAKTGGLDLRAGVLGACLHPPEPMAIKPLPPPAPDKGIQLVMPRWTLEAHSEHEVCFASYYDVTDQIPPQLRRPDGTFRYKLHETRQDPASH